MPTHAPCQDAKMADKNLPRGQDVTISQDELSFKSLNHCWNVNTDIRSSQLKLPTMLRLYKESGKKWQSLKTSNPSPRTILQCIILICYFEYEKTFPNDETKTTDWNKKQNISELTKSSLKEQQNILYYEIKVSKPLWSPFLCKPIPCLLINRK